MKRWIFLLLALPALAGCLSDDDAPTDPVPGEDDGMPIPDTDALAACPTGVTDSEGVNLVGRDVNFTELTGLWVEDRWKADYTNYRTCTVEKLNVHTLREGDPHRYLGEMDMRGDLDLGTVTALGNGELSTVYLLDITDRAYPTVLSKLEHVGTYITDIKISDDGGFLFVASQWSGQTFGSEFPDQDADPAAPNGFTIYDIRDRSAPQFQQFIPAPGGLGCHMLSHQVIDGTDVVFCVGDQIDAHGFVRNPSGQGPWVYLGPLPFLPPGSTPAPAPINAVPDCISDPPASGAVSGAVSGAPVCSGPHDMTVAEDVVDGRTYMVASHWDSGLYVVDVTKPIEEGFVTKAWWNGEGAEHYVGNVHTAMMFWVGDQRYVVATPEHTGQGVPAVWILDATELDGQLELVAQWTFPGAAVTPGLLFTTHQWQVAPTGPDTDISEPRIYITMNHAGVWVLELDDILAGDDLQAIGGFHMARPALERDTEVGNAPLSTWDVNVVDGYIYGSDRATGLWMFHYTEDPLGDERLTGFA